MVQSNRPQDFVKGIRCFQRLIWLFQGEEPVLELGANVTKDVVDEIVLIDYVVPPVANEILDRD